MPVLPLIDLLIMVGWTSLMGGCLLKAIYLSTAYRPTLLGLGPMDFLLFAGVCLLFALSLAARTWVKFHEPKLLAARRVAHHEAAGMAVQGERAGNGVTPLPAAPRAAADGS